MAVKEQAKKAVWYKQRCKNGPQVFRGKKQHQDQFTVQERQSIMDAVTDPGASRDLVE